MACAHVRLSPSSPFRPQINTAEAWGEVNAVTVASSAVAPSPLRRRTSQSSKVSSRALWKALAPAADDENATILGHLPSARRLRIRRRVLSQAVA